MEHNRLTVDAGKSGSPVATDSSGRARMLLTLPDGPNPLVVIAPGRCVTDTLSRDIYLAHAAESAPSVGDVVVGSELRGLVWAVAPHGSGFAAIPLATNLHGAHYNLESAVYITNH
jgi:hypothetical protein